MVMRWLFKRHKPETPQTPDSVSCSILTPTITERTAILSSDCENQIFHPPRMPVSEGKVNGHVVTLLRDTGAV